MFLEKSRLKAFPLSLFLFAVLWWSCESPRIKKAEIISEGCFDCFEKGTTYEDKSVVSCELSGVAYYRNMLIFADDKNIPGTSSILSLEYTIPFGKPAHIGNENTKNARKFEDLAVTPKQKYLFAVTAFDRYDPNNSRLDVYNTFLFASTDNIDVQYAAYPTRRNGVLSSARLRPLIKHALRSLKYKDGPEYFKIEGLAALPGKILLFGIREIGENYKNFDYTVTIIGAHYEIKDSIFYFKDSPRVVFRFNPSEAEPMLESPLGLSGLTFDHFNKRLYLLTSFEKEGNNQTAAYLWYFPLDKFLNREQRNEYAQRPRKNKINIGRQIRGQYRLEITEKPILVRTTQNIPLKFANKAEGITVLEDDLLFIVHDDDRNTHDNFYGIRRNINQSAYSIVQFED